MLTALTVSQWTLAVLAAFCIGLSKSGFAGLGMVTVLLMAEIMPARESTGTVLPLLICGDVLAVAVFRKHARWDYIARMLPPALVGILLGYWLMGWSIPDRAFRAVIGGIVLTLVALQYGRKLRPVLFERVPHTWGFAWLMGIWSGITTMLANAAGPIMTLYFLAVNLPKLEFVGTAATFFLIINLIKVPFSSHLGLINGTSLMFNLLLVPAVVIGIALGRVLIARTSQRIFEHIVLIFAGAAAVRLIVG